MTDAPPPAPRSARTATLMLVLVTILWGISFPLVKNWQKATPDFPGGTPLSSLTLIGLRMVLALVVFLVAQPRLFREATRREHLVGAILGAVFCLGSFFQVIGLGYTTPARSGFITSLGGAWVPLLAWAILRVPPVPIMLLGLLVGVSGSVVLSVDVNEVSKEWSVGTGEALTLLSTLLFAGQILILDRLGRRLRSAYLTAGFLGAGMVLGVTGTLMLAISGPGLSVWSSATAELMTHFDVIRDMAVLVVFSMVLGFHWMNTYQPRVSAGRAALIYFLEPLFASAFSLAWRYDEWSWRLALGGALILGGNLLVEVPHWLRPPLPSPSPGTESSSSRARSGAE
jgi:drug/metabolite transporter (DMT)-like permease